MVVLVVLNQQYLDLACAEITACMTGWGWWDRIPNQENGVILFSHARTFKGLPAFSRFAIKCLISTTRDEIMKNIEELPWKRILKNNSYRVRVHTCGGSSLSEQEIAKKIYLFGNKRVDVSTPDVQIDVVLTETKVHVGMRIWENTERFNERKSHNLPSPHPSMMHPAIARALLNLSCAKRVHDPFCGAGGLLLEAHALGLRATGGDINADMLDRARENVEGVRATYADACTTLPKVLAIVTDLPYSKNTKKVNVEALLEEFLNAAAHATNRVICGVPFAFTPKGWHVRARFEIYIHKTMTRSFSVLEVCS